MRCLQCVEEVYLLYLLHLALYHHNVLRGSTDHEVHISLCHLLLGWVYDVFSAYACYAYFGDGAFKRYVRACERARGSEACECVGLVHAVSAEEYHVDIYLGVVVAGEEGAQGTVHQSACEDFIVIGFALSFCESAGKSACRSILFTVLYLQWHEVCARHCVFCGTYGGKEHGVAHAQCA